MKINRDDFILACIFISLVGCSSIPVRQNLPDYSGIHGIPKDQRADVYTRLKVSEIDDTLVKIDGRWYSRKDFQQICLQTDAKQARRFITRVIPTTRWNKIALPLTIGGSTLVGLFGGWVGYMLTGHAVRGALTPDGNIPGLDFNFTPNQGGDSAYFSYGTLIGFGVGISLYAILRHLHNSSTPKDMLKAQELFNQNLWKQLNEDLIPKSGGTESNGIY